MGKGGGLQVRGEGGGKRVRVTQREKDKLRGDIEEGGGGRNRHREKLTEGKRNSNQE